MDDRAEFHIYDGEEWFASADGPRERAWGEAMHYAMQCEGGPRIEEVIRVPAPMGEMPPPPPRLPMVRSFKCYEHCELAIRGLAKSISEGHKPWTCSGGHPVPLGALSCPTCGSGYEQIPSPPSEDCSK